MGNRLEVCVRVCWGVGGGQWVAALLVPNDSRMNRLRLGGCRFLASPVLQGFTARMSGPVWRGFL